MSCLVTFNAFTACPFLQSKYPTPRPPSSPYSTDKSQSTLHKTLKKYKTFTIHRTTNSQTIKVKMSNKGN